MKRLIKKILAKLAPTILTANQYAQNAKLEIHPTVKLRQAYLSGTIKIGEGSKIIDGVKIISKSSVEIGRYSSLNGPGMDIHSLIHKVEIGSFCSIARGVTIQEFNHRTDRISTYYFSKNIFNESIRNDVVSKGNIVIKNDVWIGVNAIILAGVTIGNGAVVAAYSVVTKDVPDYAIVAGTPAKVIKMRFNDEIVKNLLQVKWWDWSLEKIHKNKSLFTEETTLKKLKNVM